MNMAQVHVRVLVTNDARLIAFSLKPGILKLAFH